MRRAELWDSNSRLAERIEMLQVGLYPLLRRINTCLVRWAKRKYWRLRGHTKRAQRWLVRIARRQPTMFAHWRLARPDG